MSSEKFSLKSRIKSFRFAFNGLLLLFKNEHNARIHLFAAFTASVMGFILKINTHEWCLLFIVIGLVFITELINTSLESLADIIKPERDERIMKIKDYSAAAVLISALISIIAGGLIFIPKLVALISP